MKNNLLAGCFALLLLNGPAFAQTKPAEKQHRIVFHLASSDTLVYKGLIRQLNNVLDYWPTAMLEVVVHSGGIDFMRREVSKEERDIQALKNKGVVFAVCQNTMKQRKLTKEQILSQAIFVPVAIAELTLKQEQGWSYIKVGY